MDIIQLYEDFGVVYYTEGWKYCRSGWVNVDCPYCSGSAGPHLGFCLDNPHFNCWRCGGHPVIPTISKLINLNERETYQIIKQYDIIIPHEKDDAKIRMKAHRLPSNTMSLQSNHKRYLEKRGFDPDQLEKVWKLVGTGPISALSTGHGQDEKIIDYRHRIIAPIVWEGRPVSFQGRDITNRQMQKYLTCPKDRELIFHKHILYGHQEQWEETGIIVEGITDVWRFGEKSCATFGIEFTPQQLRLISQTFKRVAVIFDGGEDQAQKQANKLVTELKFRGVDSFRVDITGDPGGMEQSEADYLVKQLIH